MFNFINKIIEYLKYGNKQDGLIDETDERDFGSDLIYIPKIEDLKKESFIVFNPTPLDQYNSDFCVGFGGAYVAEATENRLCSGAYLFAMAKKLSGTYKGFGTSILKMCKARQKFGVCKKELWDYKKGRRNYYANWKNIPQKAHDDASKHKSEAYFRLTVPYGWSKFDAIRANLWHFRDEKVLIDTGNKAHKITIIGYDSYKDALVARDTYGERTYNKGLRYIYRQEATTLFTPYIQLDKERSLIDLLVKYNGKVIKLKDNKNCYLVKESKKHFIPSEKTAWSFGHLLAPYDGAKLTEEISKEDFDKIPNGEDLKFEDGKNYWIIQRIFEKHNLIT